MRKVRGDLEANGLLKEATKVHCGVFKDIDTGEIFKFTPEEIPKMLAFLDDCTLWVAHNGIGYDVPLLEKLYGYKFKGAVKDTLLISRLQQPDRLRPKGMEGKGGPHSLGAWGYRLGRGKPEHDDWENFSEAMLHRCTEDVEILALVDDYLDKEAVTLGGKWDSARNMTFKLFQILRLQEEYGWLVDEGHANKSLQMLNHWMQRITRVLAPRFPKTYDVKEGKKAGVYGYIKEPFTRAGKLNHNLVPFWGDTHPVAGPHSRIVYRPMSLDKAEEIKKFLLDSGWEPLEWNTNDEGEITSAKLSKDDPFEGVQGSMGRLVARYVQCKARRSIIEGWLEGRREDGRLPSIVTGLAVTGRAKHSVIVNVPNNDAFFGKWMRKCFTCEKGKVLVGCDAKGCQDRMLAQRAKNDDFMNMLLNGKKEEGTDGHSLATKAVNLVLKRHNMETISRGKGKNFNFANKFGASNGKLGRMVSSNEKIGEEIKASLNEVFNAQADLVARLTKEWRKNAQKVAGKWGNIRYKNGWFTGLDGRPVHVESEHAILVYCLQSDEAITMTAAYCFLYKKLIEIGLKWGEDWAFVCFYHDEIDIECKEEHVETIEKWAEWSIGYAGKYFKLDYCPQQGEACHGKTWFDIH